MLFSRVPQYRRFAITGIMAKFRYKHSMESSTPGAQDFYPIIKLIFKNSHLSDEEKEAVMDIHAALSRIEKEVVETEKMVAQKATEVAEKATEVELKNNIILQKDMEILNLKDTLSNFYSSDFKRSTRGLLEYVENWVMSAACKSQHGREKKWEQFFVNETKGKDIFKCVSSTNMMWTPDIKNETTLGVKMSRVYQNACDIHHKTAHDIAENKIFELPSNSSEDVQLLNLYKCIAEGVGLTTVYF